MPKALKQSAARRKAGKLRPRPAPQAWATDFTPEGIEIIVGPVFNTIEEAEAFLAIHEVRMAALGSKGGKTSGAKRIKMPAGKRRAVAGPGRKGAKKR